MYLIYGTRAISIIPKSNHFYTLTSKHLKNVKKMSLFRRAAALRSAQKKEMRKRHEHRYVLSLFPLTKAVSDLCSEQLQKIYI